jgi:hypothetical protein
MTDMTEKAQDACWKLSESLLTDTDPCSPIEVAAAMVATALTLYKTVLSADDYQTVVEHIYDLRDEVRSFEKPNLQ